MNKHELLEYLKSEESKSFEGWDFSYLDARWETESLPWDYFYLVKKYLKDEYKLLDMGTGGGEFLLTLKHPYRNTFVTEAYLPNIELCMKKLKPLGITVYSVDDYHNLDILDNSFDIVINRHEEYDVLEVKRILKDGGLFITQQVGSYNNYDLVTYFKENHKLAYPGVNLDNFSKDLCDYNFDILYKNEYQPKTRFYDVGAIAYLAKIVPWEFGEFNVSDYLDKFYYLYQEIKRNHYIESKEERFIIIAKNNK